MNIFTGWRKRYTVNVCLIHLVNILSHFNRYCISPLAGAISCVLHQNPRTTFEDGINSQKVTGWVAPKASNAGNTPDVLRPKKASTVFDGTHHRKGRRDEGTSENARLITVKGLEKLEAKERRSQAVLRCFYV